MNSNKVEANYNMNFDNGHFKKGQTYQCKYDEKKEKIFVTTEEGNEQEFFCFEFNTFFTFLKN